MDLISIACVDPALEAKAQALAAKLNLPIKTESELQLRVDPGGLGLAFANDPHPFRVDFESREWVFRRRKGVAANRLFIQALALKKGQKILDLTAGFGQDAVVMSWAGADVTACENSPIIFELLSDGWNRAEWESAKRIRLLNQDSLRIEGLFDTAYLDPMFDKPKKKAKSPKPMQLLQALLEEESVPLEEWIRAARSKARRVVVKLPLKALTAGKPTAVFKGQSIRYDVY